MTKSRITPFSILFDLLLDFALIGVGFLFYYHFNVQALAPVTLNPVVVNLFGGKELAALTISGILVLIGTFNLFKTFYHLLRKP